MSSRKVPIMWNGGESRAQPQRFAYEACNKLVENMNGNNFLFEQVVFKEEKIDEDSDDNYGHHELPIDIEEIKMEPKENSPIPDEAGAAAAESGVLSFEFVKVECDPDFEVRGLSPVPKLSSCVNCQPSSDTEMSTITNMNSDYITQLFNCENCKRKFLAESALKYEMKMRKEEPKPYKCDICSLAFALKKPLNVHRRMEHPETIENEKKSVGKYTCRICKVKLTTSYSLKRHMLGHTGEKPFTCEVCSKKFTESSKLELHMRIHRGEKSYSCDVCSKNFRTNTHLKTHMLIHLEEKPYACDICSTKCRDKARLNTHMKIHNEEKPYACKYCPSKFHMKNYLSQHIRIHTGETPYSCDICQENFRYKPQLHHHMRNHTGSNCYTCDDCSKTFQFKNSLQRHIVLHHDVQNN